MRTLASAAEAVCFYLGHWLSRSPWYPYWLYRWLMMASLRLDAAYQFGRWEFEARE